MNFHSNNEESIELLGVYSKQTYLGVMLGKLALVNKILLDDFKLNFIPEEWHRHPHRLLFSELYLQTGNEKLPGVAYSALLVAKGGKSQSKETPLVVVWFQSEFFEMPNSQVVQAVAELDWNEVSAGSPFFS